MRCHVIRHVEFEDLGTLAAPLKEKGFEITYLVPGVDELQQGYEADLLIILGAPIGVHDKAHYPFLEVEEQLIKARLQAKKPMLGICLGAQLIAKSLDARVYPASQKEIGWKNIFVKNIDKYPFLIPFAKREGQMFHWHGDTFDLPEGACLVASTDTCVIQGFIYQDHCLALQFHPELEEKKIEQWLIGHAVELAQLELSPQKIRYETMRYAKDLAPRTIDFMHAWLNFLKEKGHLSLINRQRILA